MEFLATFGYWGIFLAAFLAATVLPLSSEIVLSALIFEGLSPIWLVLIATAGNVLGSLLNYMLGYYAKDLLIKKWLRISEDEFNKAEKRFKKYGLWSLCFAWVPVIGDPLTVIAGVLRIKLAWFLLLVATGKLLRYVVLSYLTLKTL